MPGEGVLRLCINPAAVRDGECVTVVLTALVAGGVVALALLVTWRLRRDQPGVAVMPQRGETNINVGALELAVMRPEVSFTSDSLVGVAGTALANVGGVELCRFETFPFESALPRLARGVVELPADEPGMSSVAVWNPGDGIELAVRANGLQVGRFVLVGPVVDDPVTMPSSTHAQIVSIVERLGSALTARAAADPSIPLPRGGTTWQTSCSSPS